MGKQFEGMLLGKGLKFGLVISRFNEFFTRKLLEGAQDALVRHGVSEEDIEVAWVPGSFEVPLIALKLAQTRKYDAIICLAAVVRGDTPHFEYVTAEITKWRPVCRLPMVSSLPIPWSRLLNGQEPKQETRALMLRQALLKWLTSSNPLASHFRGTKITSPGFPDKHAPI